MALNACGGARLEPRGPTPGQPHLSVATFNVYHPAWRDRKTVEAVGRTGADVICLQEVTADWERVLKTTYGSTYPFMLFKPRRGAGGLAVLSKYPLVDFGLLRAPHDWHPGWRLYVKTPSGPIQLMHIHLRALSTGTGGLLANFLSSKKDHEWEIRTFAEHQAAGPTLFIGDFNEGDDGAAVQWLARHGFADVVSLYHPGQPTWRARSVTTQFTLTVDHILFDSTFTPLDAKVMRIGNSDHWPIVARFEVPRAPAITIDRQRQPPSARGDSNERSLADSLAPPPGG